jgi:hypothetical protein
VGELVEAFRQFTRTYNERWLMGHHGPADAVPIEARASRWPSSTGVSTITTPSRQPEGDTHAASGRACAEVDWNEHLHGRVLRHWKGCRGLWRARRSPRSRARASPITTLRASVRHTDARWGYGQAKLRGCVFRVQRRSQSDRSPAWPGIDSTDSSADRPPVTGPQRINIRWKAQGLRFPRPEAQESRNGC